MAAPARDRRRPWRVTAVARVVRPRRAPATRPGHQREIPPGAPRSCGRPRRASWWRCRRRAGRGHRRPALRGRSGCPSTCRWPRVVDSTAPPHPPRGRPGRPAARSPRCAATKCATPRPRRSRRRGEHPSVQRRHARVGGHVVQTDPGDRLAGDRRAAGVAVQPPAPAARPLRSIGPPQVRHGASTRPSPLERHLGGLQSRQCSRGRPPRVPVLRSTAPPQSRQRLSCGCVTSSWSPWRQRTPGPRLHAAQSRVSSPLAGARRAAC